MSRGTKSARSLIRISDALVVEAMCMRKVGLQVGASCTQESWSGCAGTVGHARALRKACSMRRLLVTQQQPADRMAACNIHTTREPVSIDASHITGLQVDTFSTGGYSDIKWLVILFSCCDKLP